MRMRVENNADTRLYFYGVLQRLKTLKDKYGLPAHSAELMFWLSAQPDGTASYSVVQATCGLNDGQMARAVDALVEARLLSRGKAGEGDARRTVLSVAPKGWDGIGRIIKDEDAQPAPK